MEAVVMIMRTLGVGLDEAFEMDARIAMEVMSAAESLAEKAGVDRRSDGATERRREIRTMEELRRFAEMT